MSQNVLSLYRICATNIIQNDTDVSFLSIKISLLVKFIIILNSKHMYTSKFIQLLKDRDINYAKASKVINMTRSGFERALENGTLRFNQGITLMLKYNISFKDITVDEKNTIVSEAEERYIPQNMVSKKYYEEMRNSLQDHITSLKEQIKYLREGEK